MNKLKVICVKGQEISLWLKHHDPLDIGGNNILYDKLSHMWPGQIGETFDNYIGVLSSLVECGMPMDRTDGNFNNYFNFCVDPIPKVEDGWNRSLEEIFIERAEEIWSMDRPVRLWWSGGIDSTVALVAFLRTKKPEHELIVYCDPGPCKEENPHFWSLLETMDDITFQFNKMENIFDFSNWCDGSINITGEPGDPFYGTFVVENHINDLDKHWTDIFNWDDVNYNFRNKNDHARLLEFCEKFNAKCPFEIRNPFDFTWWIAFALKWQWIETRIAAQLPNPSNYQNMVGFYNTQEIQKWSIHNHDLKHKGTWKSYKWPSKDFIYAYDGNADYRDNKTKERSLPKTYPMKMSNEIHYGTPFINQLIMSDGSYHKILQNDPDYGLGYDPEINLYDMWDIYNKPVWDEWKKQM
jgi:hypothetical protein